MDTGSLSPRVKRPVGGVDHPPLSTAEVRERVELYLYPSLACCRVNFTFTFTFKDLRALTHVLGIGGFYVGFVKICCLICEPLRALKRKEAKFMWAPPQQEAFKQLNLTLPTAPF